MNLKEAKKTLDQIAPEAYRSISYEIVTDDKGEMKQTCSIYVDGFGSFNGAFWETVFADLQARTDGRPAISEDL